MAKTTRKSPKKTAAKAGTKAKSATSKKTIKKTPARKKATPTAKKAAKKAPVKKAPVKKAAKKTAAKKVTAKKPAAKKTAKKVAKTAAAKKPSARKAAPTKPVKKATAKAARSRKPAAAPKAAKGAARGKATKAKAAEKPEIEDKTTGRFATAHSFDFDFGKDKVDSLSGGAAPEEEQPEAVELKKRSRGNAAGLSSREVKHFRELLLRKRREVMGDVSSMEQEALHGEGDNIAHLTDMADAGTDQYEQEFTLEMMERDRELVAEINHALQKVEDGTYGVCEGTGQPINKARLEARPWVRYGIEHARRIEKGRPAILHTD